MKTFPKDTTCGTLFENIRRHAVTLHSVIKNSWKCNCEVSHLTSLQLQKRQASDCPPRFIINLALPQREPTSANSRRKLLIYAKDSQDTLKLEKPQPVLVQETYITQLRTNLRTKSVPNVNSTTPLVRAGPHSSSSSASSSFSFRSILTKSESNMTTASSISSLDGTGTSVDKHFRQVPLGEIFIYIFGIWGNQPRKVTHKQRPLKTEQTKAIQDSKYRGLLPVTTARYSLAH